MNDSAAASLPIAWVPEATSLILADFPIWLWNPPWLHDMLE
jgi:hypothetical protein